MALSSNNLSNLSTFNDTGPTKFPNSLSLCPPYSGTESILANILIEPIKVLH